MNRKSIPKSDSIQELARFWDTHDLTDFEEELAAVNESRTSVQKRTLCLRARCQGVLHLRSVWRHNAILHRAPTHSWRI